MYNSVYLFIFIIWSSLPRGLSLVAESEGHSVTVRRLLLVAASLVRSTGTTVRGLRQLWPPGSRAQAQQLWFTGLVALRKFSNFK